jgi:hypothetical protein
MIGNNDYGRFDRDDRGVSEILGGIFIFALVIMVLVLLQVWAVPAANQQTEFEHNQRVLGDFQQFGSEVDRAAGLGVLGSSPIEAGTRYSPRFLLLNPSAPAGTVETSQRSVSVRNVQATNPETGSKYLVGDTEYVFETRAVAYRPGYNEYANPPTTRYEGWTLYNDFEGTNRVYTRKGLLSDRTIRLTMLDGNLSQTSQSSITLPTTPISAPSQSVAVRGANPNAPVTLRLETGLSADDWNGTLDSESNFAGATQIDNETVEIRLRYADDSGQPIPYNLRMAKVGIGQGTTAEGAHYLTVVGDEPEIDGAGGSVTVDVRDRFNNPVPGVNVTFSSSQGTIPEPVVTSDQNGRATAEFRNPTAERVTITAMANVNAGDRQIERGRVVFDGIAVEGGTSARDSEINPSDDASFTQESAVFRSAGGNQGPWYADVTFENQGEDRVITAVRVNAYILSTFNRGQSTFPEEADITSGNAALPRATIQGPYVPHPTANARVAEGSSRTLSFEFLVDNANYEPDAGDFFVVSIRFDDGSVGRYFVQPRFS